MSYTPNPTWQNDAAGDTPIDAQALNNIEGGIVDAHTGLADLALKLQGDTQNAFDLGMVRNSSSAATANSQLINIALQQGNVYLPEGTWWIDSPIRIPSFRSLRGAGARGKNGPGVTWIKMANGAASNDPCVTNLGNNNLPHTTPDTWIHVADLAIDGNRANRNSDPQVNENGCGLRFSCVEHALVERVYSVNGVHSFDAAASVYMPDALSIDDPNKMPPGPSRWVTFRDCVAGGSEDDAFTCHGSYDIRFENCIAWNHEAVPRTAHSNGFEIDDGSRDTTLIGCYAHGFHDGFQVKGHNQNLPALRTSLIDCTADQCQIGFRAFWDSVNMSTYTGPYPPFEIAADVLIKGCKVTNALNSDGGASTPALIIEAYTHVTVEDFVVFDNPTANILLRSGCSDVRMTNIRAENTWTQPYDPTLGLITLGSTCGKDIRLSNIRVTKYNSPIEAVVCNQTSADASYFVEDVKVAGTVPTTVWAASTAYPAGTTLKLSTGEILGAVTGGTSGSAQPAPPGYSATVTDGTVTWIRLAGAAVRQAANTSQKQVVRITQTGLPFTAYVPGVSTYTGQPPIVTGWWL